MRDISIIVATALVTAVITGVGMNTLTTSSLGRASATRASISLDAMQIMKDAKNLPEQNYDAY